MSDHYQVFYLGIVFGSQMLFIPAALPRLRVLHRVFALISSFTPHYFTYRCVTSTSSVVTSQNHWQNMRYYPYDHVLYEPGQVCRTCRFLKPARSKHCSFCNACVAKHDHHCVWVMNCLGKDNYIYFIGLLLSLASMLIYAIYLTYTILDETLQSETLRRSDGMESRKHWSKGRSWSLYFRSWAWAVTQDIRVGGVGMLAFMTAPLAWGMFLYHIYLIWAGMTTNENSKWSDWKDDIADGLVYKLEGNTGLPDGARFDLDYEPLVDWPISSNQRIVKCEDGQPPKFPANRDGSMESSEAISPQQQEWRWRRVQSLSEVDNLYDLGFWDNLGDVLAVG